MKVQPPPCVTTPHTPNLIPSQEILSKTAKAFGLSLDLSLSIQEQQYACFEGVFAKLEARKWEPIPSCIDELNQLTDEEGRTLLIRALDLHPYYYDLAVELATHKIGLERLGPGDNTPLHYAARTANSKVINLLYSSTAVMDKNRDKETPLDVAFKHRQTTAIKTLLTIPQLNDKTPIWTSFFNFGNRYFDQGHFSEAKAMFLSALEVAQLATNPTIPRLEFAKCWHHLGNTHFSLKEYREAGICWENEYRLILDLPSANVLAPLKLIALAYAYQGDEEKVLKTLEKTNQLMNHSTLVEYVDFLNHAGICWFQLCRYLETIKLHEKAYKMIALGAGHQTPSMINCLEQIANCYEQLDEIEEARKNLEAASEIAVRLMGSETPILKRLKAKIDSLQRENHQRSPRSEWNRLNLMGLKFSEKKAFGEALKIHLKALQVAKAHFKEEDPEVISSLGQIVDCCFELKRYPDHRAYLREQIPLVKNDPSQERILLHKIADSYFCESRFEEASRAYQKLLSPSPSSPSSPSEMEILILIGHCHLGMGSYHRAIQYFQIAYIHTALKEKKDNKLLIRALSGLVKCYEYLNDVAQISHKDQLLCLLEEQEQKAQ